MYIHVHITKYVPLYLCTLYLYPEYRGVATPLRCVRVECHLSEIPARGSRRVRNGGPAPVLIESSDLIIRPAPSHQMLFIRRTQNNPPTARRTYARV